MFAIRNAAAARWLGVLILVLAAAHAPAQADKYPLINSGELIKQASEKHDAGDYKEALRLYGQINRSDTNYADVIYEVAYSLYADSQYQACLAKCAEGIRLYPAERTKYILLQGSALDELDRMDEAVATYTEGLQLQPYNHLFFFNRAVVYNRKKMYDSARADFQQCLLINPYYASAHYLIAADYLRQGLLPPAMMAAQMYLLLAPSGRYQKAAIQLMNKITKGTDEATEAAAQATDEMLGNYAPVQQILLSKAALDKSYKLNTSLDDPLVRQSLVIIEQLQLDTGSTDFAMQVYAPFFKKMLQQNLLDPMYYTMFGGLDIAAIQSWLKKNDKLTKQLVEQAQRYLNDIRTSHQLKYHERATNSYCYLWEDGFVKGEGPCKNNDPTAYYGAWTLYHNNGAVSNKGTLDDQKRRQGIWQTYYRNGQLKEKTNYTDNLAQGASLAWHENGQPWLEYNVRNDTLHGKQKSYFYNGMPRIESEYEAGKQTGEEREYTYTGFLHAISQYKNGQKEGPQVLYYPNGKKKEELNYQNGKEEGPFAAYNQDGQLTLRGSFKAGKRHGLWVGYYNNGQPKDSTMYVDGEITGVFSEYFENGMVSRRGRYQNKKLDGQLDEYDDDGKLFCRSVYDRGRLREISYFNKKNETISSATTRNGKINIVTYSPDGYKTSEGMYDKEGYRNGDYTAYYKSGAVYRRQQYINGKEEGPTIEYFANGAKRGETSYKSGVEDGYKISYHISGKIASEGWVKDDQQEQQFRFYSASGLLTSTEFYKAGDLDGYNTHYYPNGNIKWDIRYWNSWIQHWTQYDSNGVVLSDMPLEKGDGPLLLKHFNGNTMTRSSYKNYLLNGPYEMFYYDGRRQFAGSYKNGQQIDSAIYWHYNGKPEAKGYYVLGQREGSWKYYTEEGNLREEETYVHGNLHGRDVIYNADGTLERIIHFKEGRLHGPYQLYGPGGQLAVQLNYRNGQLVSYTYEGKDGKLLPAKPLKPTGDQIVAYYKSGAKSAEIEVKDEEQHGIKKLFAPDGTVIQQEMRVLGYIHGLRTFFYPNGKPRLEETFNHGELHGATRGYHPNGKLKFEKYYVDDDAHGSWKYYNEAGALVQTRVYYYGTLLSVKE
jgi:antitoxin component YwqK of YwqJK toxin-antitoxin module/cytochrome c-type biogenesis protein CcmH/NrfG